MSNKYDVIVIGSGPAGANAAYPIVKSKLNVLMIDGGITQSNDLEQEFKGNFEQIRKTRLDQYKLFLGEDLSGIPLPGKQVHSDSMTKGARKYISERTEELLPTKNNNVEISQSLAKGGLSEAWGAACGLFDQEELEQVGIPYKDMKKHYQTVIDRIGVSGASSTFKIQPLPRLDHHGRRIISKYLGKKLNFGRFELQPAMLAMLTQPIGKRNPINYDDLDYSLNRGGAIYRSRFTVEEMQSKKNFSYLPNYIVEKFETKKGLTTVYATGFDKKKVKFTAKYVVVAAGSLNTNRILLKSFNLFNTKVPFIIKKHTLIPCLNISSLGKAGDKKRFSLCQLFIYDKLKNNGVSKSFTQIYSYKSLMLFKLLEYSPLPAPEALSILSMFTPSTLIADVRFPSFSENETTLSLNKDNLGKEFIKIDNKSKSNNKNDSSTLRKIKWFLFRLGLVPIKTIDTPFGSTAHYAGGVPFSSSPSKVLSTDESGRLHQNPNIFIADASTWKALPPKPPALTIMANADRIGNIVAKEAKN